MSRPLIVPSNWTDDLLTGKNAVIGKPPYGCPDIERLLNVIRERVDTACCLELHRGKQQGILAERRRIQKMLREKALACRSVAGLQPEYAWSATAIEKCIAALTHQSRTRRTRT